MVPAGFDLMNEHDAAPSMLNGLALAACMT